MPLLLRQLAKPSLEHDLSPRWGLSGCQLHPRLTPWAAFLRRFAAAGSSFYPTAIREILVLTRTHA